MKEREIVKKILKEIKVENSILKPKSINIKNVVDKYAKEDKKAKERFAYLNAIISNAEIFTVKLIEKLIGQEIKTNIDFGLYLNQHLSTDDLKKLAVTIVIDKNRSILCI